MKEKLKSENRLTVEGAYYFSQWIGGATIAEIAEKRNTAQEESDLLLEEWLGKASKDDIKKIYLRLQEYEDRGLTPHGVSYADSASSDWSGAQGNQGW
jgi:hypothetical protein